ncbi:hypothetical protein AALO_G00144420 [Alosa alosa]|uniref:Uncharacterized protein n=1 Tax=Alosa alosa TaxID=278164 RepID=A0AAV6GMX5_9TELE|nr:hypothetical protein AALO_G00144420 [Alosa alosa]
MGRQDAGCAVSSEEQCKPHQHTVLKKETTGHQEGAEVQKKQEGTGTAATKNTGTVIIKLLVCGNSQLKASLEHRSIHLLSQHQPKEDGFPQQPGSSQGFFQLPAGSFSLPPLPNCLLLGA